MSGSNSYDDGFGEDGENPYAQPAEPQEQADGDDGASSDSKPRILLMGLRRYVSLLRVVGCRCLRLTLGCRSGKSSIQKVVFHKMSPNETLFLESTAKIVKNDISNSSFVQFSVWYGYHHRSLSRLTSATLQGLPRTAGFL